MIDTLSCALPRCGSRRTGTSTRRITDYSLIATSCSCALLSSCLERVIQRIICAIGTLIERGNIAINGRQLDPAHVHPSMYICFRHAELLRLRGQHRGSLGYPAHTHTITILATGRSLLFELVWVWKPSERQRHAYFSCHCVQATADSVSVLCARRAACRIRITQDCDVPPSTSIVCTAE